MLITIAVFHFNRYYIWTRVSFCFVFQKCFCVAIQGERQILWVLCIMYNCFAAFFKKKKKVSKRKNLIFQWNERRVERLLSFLGFYSSTITNTKRVFLRVFYMVTNKIFQLCQHSFNSRLHFGISDKSYSGKNETEEQVIWLWQFIFVTVVNGSISAC